MALERVFQELIARLRKLRDALKEVRLTVIEDRPREDPVVVVDHFEYALEDILGWLEEAVTSGAEAQQSVALPLNLDRAVRCLSRCQDLFQRIQRSYLVSLISYGRLEELTSVGKEKRGEWQGWAESVKKGLEQCRKPMEDASLALIHCWQEIAERPAGTSVTVQTTNVGQQITSRTRENQEQVQEGVT
jgi:hypothetical protein